MGTLDPSRCVDMYNTVESGVERKGNMANLRRYIQRCCTTLYNTPWVYIYIYTQTGGVESGVERSPAEGDDRR